MKFDNIIIGGGLAGLTCGIRLSQQGKKCVIISSGQSALNFSSGSFDLLNFIDGKQVNEPLASLDELTEKYPEHPYTKIGKQRISSYSADAKMMFESMNIKVKGDAKKNHFRVTPMGYLKPTWLSLNNMATTTSEEILPWKKIAICNITGFLDFYPQFIADELSKKGVTSTIHNINLPELTAIRRNPSEFRVTNISRYFNRENGLQVLADFIKKQNLDVDAIMLPACFDIKTKTEEKLSSMVNKQIKLIPALPLSIAGVDMQQTLVDYFEKLGGVFMLGDTVNKIELKDDKAVKVYTYCHEDIPFMAKNIVLASGSFFNRGLMASRDKIFEPVLDLDVEYSNNREDWYSKNFFDKQNYMHYGVKTDHQFHAIKNGKVISNLYVVGAILAGFDALKEGSGSGVSLFSAMFIADEILKN